MSGRGTSAAMAAMAATLATAACHRAAEDPTAVTPDEQSRLNEAAASLDANAATGDGVGDRGGADGNR